MFVVEQSMSAINLLMHKFGARPYRTRDDNSRNLVVMAWLAWGNNNHHTFRQRLDCAGLSPAPDISLSVCLLRWGTSGSQSLAKIALCRMRDAKPEAVDIEHGWSLLQGDYCRQSCCSDVEPRGGEWNMSGTAD